MDAYSLIELVARASSFRNPLRMPVSVLSFALHADSEWVYHELMELAAERLLVVDRDPASGHIHSVSLSPLGRETLDAHHRCHHRLDAVAVCS